MALGCGGASSGDPGQGTSVSQSSAPLFRDVSGTHLPAGALDGLSMDAGVADMDGDGDLDILFANFSAFVENADPRNRLLINDGRGFFTDETEERLPGDPDSSFDGDGLEDVYLASRGTGDRLLLKVR